MKKILLFFCLIMGIVCMTGCSGEVAVGMVEANTATSINVRYSSLTGTKEYTIRVEEETDIQVEITTESGSISLSIEGNYEGKDLETTSFKVTVPQGSYKVIVQANKHKGSYKLTW